MMHFEYSACAIHSIRCLVFCCLFRIWFVSAFMETVEQRACDRMFSRKAIDSVKLRVVICIPVHGVAVVDQDVVDLGAEGLDAVKQDVEGRRAVLRGVVVAQVVLGAAAVHLDGFDQDVAAKEIIDVNFNVCQSMCFHVNVFLLNSISFFQRICAIFTFF